MSNEAEGDICDELAKEPASEEFGAWKIHESSVSPRDGTAQDNATDGGATEHDLRDCGDICTKETTKSGLNKLPEEAGLQINPTVVPHRKSLSYKNKIKGT